MSFADKTIPIQDRLRECAELDAAEGCEPSVVAMMEEAADEIDGLIIPLAKFGRYEYTPALTPKGAEDAAEIDRLRNEIAALKKQVEAARSEGRLKAFAIAMSECCKLSKRSDANERTWQEIHNAIHILHFKELQNLARLNKP